MGTRTDSLIKLVIVALLSVLSFSLGTLAGKKFHDAYHQQKVDNGSKGE